MSKANYYVTVCKCGCFNRQIDRLWQYVAVQECCRDLDMMKERLNVTKETCDIRESFPEAMMPEPGFERIIKTLQRMR